MKLKNTLLASALLTTATLSAHAATELTPEQAAALKPYDRVVVTGRFNAIGDAVQAVSRKADKDGADSMLSTRRTTAMAATGASRLTFIKKTRRKRMRRRIALSTA